MSLPLVVTNFDPRTDDVLYTNEHGAWNVSRALRDCRAHKHKCYSFPVADLYAANAEVEVDPIKVAVLMRALDLPPLLAVIEDGKAWLIDGHHRLRAMKLRGDEDCVCYVIEEDASAPYIVLYNGERLPPFPLT